MRLLGHLFAIIFLALLLGYTSDARMPDLGFDLLDHEKGLSNDAVRCLLQDRTGFLWVGTENGLNRYDGTRFTVYRNQADRPESLSGNLVTSLFEDRDGNLWVGTFDAGLNRFRPESNDFERVPISTSGSEKLFPTVYIMAQAPDGSLWFGAQGSLFAGDPKTGKFRRFYKPGGIKQLVFDQKGLLWVGGNFGLSVFSSSGLSRPESTFRGWGHSPPSRRTDFRRYVKRGAGLRYDYPK
jgi:ligand-binding sensor domain-containing protein